MLYSFTRNKTLMCDTSEAYKFYFWKNLHNLKLSMIYKWVNGQSATVSPKFKV